MYTILAEIVSFLPDDRSGFSALLFYIFVFLKHVSLTCLLFLMNQIYIYVFPPPKENPMDSQCCSTCTSKF